MGILLILLTYFYYPYLKKNKIIRDQPIEQKAEEILGNNEKTTFDNAKMVLTKAEKLLSNTL